MKRRVPAAAPSLASRSLTGDMAGTAGVRLGWRAVEDPSARAAVVLVAGHGQSYHGYDELLYDLRDMGVSVYALDPRGQGASQRLLADPGKGHVERWQHYVADLRIFVDTIVRRRSPGRLIAIGHSLGGGIVAAFLAKHPGTFDSAVLSAPLVGLAAGRAAAALLALLEPFCGQSYIPGGGPFHVKSFEENRETHSRARHERKFQDFADHPEARMGEPTVHWLNEVRRMAREVRAAAGGITVPILVFQAGQDVYVSGRAIEGFCRNAPRCRRVLVEGAWHELFIEADQFRGRVIRETRAFIAERLGPAAGS